MIVEYGSIKRHNGIRRRYSQDARDDDNVDMQTSLSVYHDCHPSTKTRSERFREEEIICKRIQNSHMRNSEILESFLKSIIIFTAPIPDDIKYFPMRILSLSKEEENFRMSTALMPISRRRYTQHTQS